jgi:hypothetical protein
MPKMYHIGIFLTQGYLVVGKSKIYEEEKTVTQLLNNQPSDIFSILY